MNYLRKLSLLSSIGLRILTAQAMDIDTARGTVSVPDAPHPLAVYDLGTLDTLLALGVPIDGVPQNTYREQDIPGNPAPVGSVSEADLEAVATLQPKLVIVGERSRKQYEVLRELAPTIDLSLGAGGGEHIYQNGIARARQLAALYDKQAEADDLITSLEASRDAAKAAAQNSGSGLIILTSGRIISLLGKDSLVGWLVEELDLDLIDDKPQSRITDIEPISFEYLAAKQPDWLIVIDRDQAIGQASGSSAEALFDNELVAQTPAAKNKRIIFLDGKDASLAIGGLSTMQRTLDALRSAFH